MWAESRLTRPDAARPEEWVKRGALWIRARKRLQSCLSGFRRVVGMPDYPEYLRHLEQRHPDWPLPTEREFFDMYLRSRYGDGPTRCC